MKEPHPETPPYLRQRLVRHGAAVDRLIGELKAGKGEFHAESLTHALAFDAADMIWAALTELQMPPGEPYPIRGIRNHIAETILRELELHGIDDSQGIEALARHDGGGARSTDCTRR